MCVSPAVSKNSVSYVLSITSGSYNLSACFSALTPEGRLDEDVPLKTEFSKVSHSVQISLFVSTHCKENSLKISK